MLILSLSEIEEMVIEDGSYDDSSDDDCGDYDDDDGFSLIRSNLQPFLIQSLLLTQGLPYRSNPHWTLHCTSAHCTLDKWTSVQVYTGYPTLDKCTLQDHSVELNWSVPRFTHWSLYLSA